MKLYSFLYSLIILGTLHVLTFAKPEEEITIRLPPKTKYDGELFIGEHFASVGTWTVPFYLKDCKYNLNANNFSCYIDYEITEDNGETVSSVKRYDITLELKNKKPSCINANTVFTRFNVYEYGIDMKGIEKVTISYFEIGSVVEYNNGELEIGVSEYLRYLKIRTNDKECIFRPVIKKIIAKQH
ncbi:hypothetical protein BCR32DRAFT_306563 [Anaeromyces robustus]|uniref:Uncharacterized protein n=1 Tax=Anaeromyces robustus TaxID=1754192 RepID=A0A1Y1VUR1_9FUNG|nr:hypothetical protein BCR32DRAFT_306563 [Anaeromyces robustus]|eukprot:ORX64756.1 hypothetical protein BCR32DRAFT_306563 [Anaeromyces robustus]